MANVSLKQILFNLQLGIKPRVKIKFRDNYCAERFIDELIKNYSESFILDSLECTKNRIITNRENHIYSDDSYDRHLVFVIRENNKIAVYLSNVVGDMDYLYLNGAFIVWKKERK